MLCGQERQVRRRDLPPLFHGPGYRSPVELGAATLAYLYQKLNEASTWTTRQLVGSCTLLTVRFILTHYRIYLFIYLCFVFIFNTLSCLCFRAESSPTSPASTASATILHTWTPCPGPPDTLSRGGTMRWDHTVCTWIARCTTTSPGGRSSTTLRLSPLTALLYIQAGWHAGPASWSGISQSGACVSLDCAADTQVTV